MLCDYRDITSQLGRPQWWDEYGVPRYCPFGPDEAADIYARAVCLLRIECQSCGAPFDVAMSTSNMDVALGRPTLEQLVTDDQIHYGDPPCAPGCCGVGATMNSVPRRVIEFWRRDGDNERVPDLEREIACSWAEEADHG